MFLNSCGRTFMLFVTSNNFVLNAIANCHDKAPFVFVPFNNIHYMSLNADSDAITKLTQTIVLHILVWHQIILASSKANI